MGTQDLEVVYVYEMDIYIIIVVLIVASFLTPTTPGKEACSLSFLFFIHL